MVSLLRGEHRRPYTYRGVQQNLCLQLRIFTAFIQVE
jgi:hypothetical protein